MIWRNNLLQLTCCLLLALLLSGSPIFSLVEEVDRSVFTPSEWEQLKREKTLNPRLKIYIDACKRHIGQIRRAFSENKESELRDGLTAFVSLLKMIEEDINNNGNRKARNLKRFEISLRENTSTLRELQKSSILSQQELFEDAIDRSERLRKAVLSLIFGEDKFKDQ